MAANFDLGKIRATLDKIPAGYTDRVSRNGWFPSSKYEDGTQVAYVAAIQEFGAPAQNIPPRPFLRPAIQAHQAGWVSDMARGVQATVKGSRTADEVLEMIGLKVTSDVQAQLESGAYTPLSPTTVLLRKWRREGRTITGKTVGEAAAAVAKDPTLIEGVNADPLRDTGLLIASIGHDVGDAE